MNDIIESSWDVLRHMILSCIRTYNINTVKNCLPRTRSVNDLIEPNNKNLEVRESISAGIYINRLTEKRVESF